MTSNIIGIDIGGSHATAALVDVHHNCIDALSKCRIAVDANGSADEIISTWTSLFKNNFKNAFSGDVNIGLAMPGPFDYNQGISKITGLHKFESLYDVNVKQALASALNIPARNIKMMNDAAAFLRGEVYGGAAKGFADVIGVTLGTGTGSAIHHNGITIDANLGPSPYKESIADDYFSTRWFVNEYRRRTGYEVTGVKALALLHHSQGVVKEIFNDFVQNFSEFLLQFIQREQAACVVLGGNIMLAKNYFLPKVQSNLIHSGSNIPLKVAELGEDAAIIGAAMLFRD
jgi:glucokinase